jgi:hypothetical protein
MVVADFAAVNLNTPTATCASIHTPSYASTYSPPSSPLPHSFDLAPQQSLPRTFSRAANIIRECLEVQGTVFYTSGVASYDGTLSGLSESGSRAESVGSDDASNSNTTDPDLPHGTKTPVGECPIIAYSESQASSINDEPPPETLNHFSGKFLRSLLRRYPKGKIFHLGAKGTLTSGSSGDEVLTDSTTVSVETSVAGAEQASNTKKKQDRVRLRDGAMLLKHFPGARSVAFFPLWDTHQERWYAGGFVWTLQPNRSFTIEGQLSFLNAIASTIMAEISRLNALTSDRAKTDLLGSISHELRSPLHGVLGSVELLDGSLLTEFQADMVHSIETCGRTLLDTIEQVCRCELAP